FLARDDVQVSFESSNQRTNEAGTTCRTNLVYSFNKFLRHMKVFPYAFKSAGQGPTVVRWDVKNRQFSGKLFQPVFLRCSELVRFGVLIELLYIIAVLDNLVQ